MKLIYVAHPYGGNLDNRKACARIIDNLQERFQNLVFVAGATSIGGSYQETPYHVGLAHCMELLNRCDGILMTGKWKESTGCKAEMAFAQWRGLKIYDSLESLKEEFPCKE